MPTSLLKMPLKIFPLQPPTHWANAHLTSFTGIIFLLEMLFVCLHDKFLSFNGCPEWTSFLYLALNFPHKTICPQFWLLSLKLLVGRDSLGWMRRNWTAKLKLMKWGNESADMIEIFLLLFCQSHLLNSCYHCMSYIYAVWLSLYTALHLPKKRKTQKVKYSTNWPTLKALKLSTSFLQLVPSHKHSLNHLSIDTIFNTLILLS